MSKYYGNEYLLRKEESKIIQPFIGLNDYEKAILMYELIAKIYKNDKIKVW